MDIERLIRRYPRLYHMAHDGSWPSIQQHGLLSTTALLDLFEIGGDRRVAIESNWRGASVLIDHPVHGQAVIRDQLPLRPDLLARCLHDRMTPAEWYRTLNARVFFWVTEANLNVLLGAKAYRNHAQTVLTVDTRRLLERQLPEVQLSSINSGSIIRGGAARGKATFKHPASHTSPRVVELSVIHAVPAVTDVVVRADRRTPDGRRSVLYESSS